MSADRSEGRNPENRKETGEIPDPNIPVETERELEPGPGPEGGWTPEKESEPVAET